MVVAQPCLQGEDVRRRERGETGGPCGRPWTCLQPRDHTVEVDRGRDRDVLEVRFATVISMPF